MLYTLQDISVYKIPSFRTGRWDRTGREHSYCRHLQGRRGSAPWQLRQRKVSQVQNQLCAPRSPGPPLMCALSPEGLLTTSPHFRSGLNIHEVSTTHSKGVGGGGVPGYCSCWFFPMPCTNEEIFCLPYLYGQGSTRGEEMAGLLCPLLRGGKPRMTAEVMYCSYTCVTDFSPSSALSSVEAELQLEAGTRFLRKEEKLGNVY